MWLTSLHGKKRLIEAHAQDIWSGTHKQYIQSLIITKEEIKTPRVEKKVAFISSNYVC